MAKKKAKKKHAGGRPTKYKEEYCSREYIQGYLDECEDKEELISICGFSCYIGSTEETLQNWGRKYPQFLRSLGIIKQKSKQMLCNKGLKGDYNSTIAKLMLSANHGLREGTDVTSGGESITIKLPEKFKDI